MNASTGTARLRGVFENEDRDLASGLFVRVRIPVSKPYQALLIPERALATDQNIKFVYVVGERRRRRRGATWSWAGSAATCGSSRPGLTAGDRVIVKGLQRVRPGQKVEAEAEPAASSPKPSELHAGRTASDCHRDARRPNAVARRTERNRHGEILHRPPDLRRGHLGDHHAGRRRSR